MRIASNKTGKPPKPCSLKSRARVTKVVIVESSISSETCAAVPHAFVPWKFELSEAFQFDWSEEGLVIGRVYRRMQVSYLKRCASRASGWLSIPARAMKCCLMRTRGLSLR
jgi:hypothetical protein